jgi:hypothetical protein
MYDFYIDPTRSWLRVSVSELLRLDLIDQITAFSYMKDDVVFLESDCDAAVFIAAKRNHGEKVIFKDHTTKRNSRIRKYSPYSQQKALQCCALAT